MKFTDCVEKNTGHFPQQLRLPRGDNIKSHTISLRAETDNFVFESD